METSHLIQLLIALCGGIFLFLLSQFKLQRVIFQLLVLIVPFQLIDSQYGSINMAITYVLGASMFMNRQWLRGKRELHFPFVWLFAVFLFAFVLAWTQAPAMAKTKTIFYLIGLISNVMMFYMTFNFVTSEDDVHRIFHILFICNILVIAYCLVQVFMGAGRFSFFGIQELTMLANRAEKGRLVGPFMAVGITAEYIVIQTLLIGYYILNAKYFRKTAILLFFFNFAILVGTGNRGGFISLLLGMFLFSLFFMQRIGKVRVMMLNLSILILFASASFVMIKYTDFNVLFERIAGTRFDGSLPDTRAGWGTVVEKIMEKPIIGHGPRLVVRADPGVPSIWPKGEIDFYPHSLYLYILYTMGGVGLLVYTAIGFRLFVYLNKIRFSNEHFFLKGLPRLGVIILVVFLFDQLKVEFLRNYFLDYQHYIAVVFGLFCGLQNLTRTTGSHLRQPNY